MKEYCLSMHCRLKEELADCKKKDLCFIKKTEACFAIAYHYWNTVKNKMVTFPFKEEVEIEFFKEWKPAFTSEIEYYSLLYHAAIFEPGDLNLCISFWEREYGRLQKFEGENKAFLSCYQASSCQMSKYYFLRRYTSVETLKGAKLYDAGTKLVTNGDHLVATFLALQRYIEYVKGKIGRAN